jgi:hypothetical protein
MLAVDDVREVVEVSDRTLLGETHSLASSDTVLRVVVFNCRGEGEGRIFF